MISFQPTASIAARYRLRRSGRDWAGPCPHHGGSSAPFKMREGLTGAPVFTCHAGCEQRDVLAALVRDGMAEDDRENREPPRGRDPRPERPPQAAGLPPSKDWSEEAAGIWREAAADRDLLRPYFRARGLEIDPPTVLRYLRPGAGASYTLPDHPRMVALVTDTVTARPISLHFTALKGDGSGKAAIDRPKRLLFGHRKAGCVVRLSPDDAVAYGLGISEGVETGAKVLAGGWGPLWAAIDAGNMGAFPVLCGVQSLTLWADNDASGTGQKRAGECAERWRAAGREVAIMLPPNVGNDWDDELARAS